VLVKLENGEVIAKEINSHEDIDEELVGYSDSSYNKPYQIERMKWLIKRNMKKPIMEIGTASGYVLNKLDGDIGIDIRPDRLLVAKRKYPDKMFCYGNIFNLTPFYDMGINSVVMSDILEYLPFELSHHAIIHCLNVAPVVYYTVQDATRDMNVIKNPEYKWHPTVEKVDSLMKFVNMHIKIDYNINKVSNFLCGIIRKIKK
jgi:hypothetical protein